MKQRRNIAEDNLIVFCIRNEVSLLSDPVSSPPFISRGRILPISFVLWCVILRCAVLLFSFVFLYEEQQVLRCARIGIYSLIDFAGRLNEIPLIYCLRSWELDCHRPAPAHHTATAPLDIVCCLDLASHLWCPATQEGSFIRVALYVDLPFLKSQERISESRLNIT